ncbi:MAG: hypothetical protein WKF35_01285 [Ferruginibacter sp.]
MAINLLEKVTENLGLKPLVKIDPNTQQTKNTASGQNEQTLAQALVPAVLAGLYQLSKSEEGIRNIAGGDQHGWASLLFGQHKEEVIGNVAGLGFSTYQETEIKINDVAGQAVKIIREVNPDVSDNYAKMKDFIKNQRDNILPYLPPQLHLGNLMDNSTMDDNTNKMQGPVSSLMHKIEATFGGNETEEDAQKKTNKF